MERNDRGVVCGTTWYLPGSEVCCPSARHGGIPNLGASCGEWWDSSPCRFTPRRTLTRMLVGLQNESNALEEWKISCLWPGMETRFLGRPSRCLLTIPATSLEGPKKTTNNLWGWVVSGPWFEMRTSRMPPINRNFCYGGLESNRNTKGIF